MNEAINLRWLRAKQFIGEEMQAYQFSAWLSNRWSEFGETLGLKGSFAAEQVFRKLGLEEGQRAFDAWLMDDRSITSAWGRRNA